MAILYAEEIADEDRNHERTGVVYKVDTEDFTVVRIAVFDNLEHLDSFMRSWNGEASLDPQ